MKAEVSQQYFRGDFYEKYWNHGSWQYWISINSFFPFLFLSISVQNQDIQLDKIYNVVMFKLENVLIRQV